MASFLRFQSSVELNVNVMSQPSSGHKASATWKKFKYSTAPLHFTAYELEVARPDSPPDDTDLPMC